MNYVMNKTDFFDAVRSIERIYNYNRRNRNITNTSTTQDGNLTKYLIGTYRNPEYPAYIVIYENGFFKELHIRDEDCSRYKIYNTNNIPEELDIFEISKLIIKNEIIRGHYDGN